MAGEVKNSEKRDVGIIEKGINSVSDIFSEFIKKYLPDPLIFAVLLTVITGLLGIFLENKTPLQMVTYWGEGFWNLLTFSMQMILILLGGSVLAQTPVVQRLLNRVAEIPKSPRTAIMLATFATGVMSWLNWGFGLIAGTLLAKKIAERVQGVHYPLIIAASYTAFGIYGFGISASTPLLIATKGHFLEEQMGIIPISETIFHPVTIVLSVALLITLPIVNSMIKPKGKLVQFKAPPEPVVEPVSKRDLTPAEKAETSPLVIWIAGVMGIVFVIWYFTVNNGTVNINIINFIFLFLAMILHGNARAFIRAISEAAKGTGAMAVQFPFYAGIMGMMTASGLVTTIAGWFVAIATPETLPFWGFISSMLINIFVPSGGGHWVVQGPFMVEAANAMGANLAATAQSVCYGNGVQDILQPMWILPALALSGLGIRDIMGYNLIAFLWAAFTVGIGVLSWGFFF